MIDNLIGFSIRNKIIIGLFTFALIAWGAYSLTQLPIDAVPDITNNQVQVITTAPTLAAQEVERFITYPVEVSMATIPNVLEIRSISRFGLSVITIVFKDEVEVLDARQMVAERLKTAQEQIPQGLGNPYMAPITTGLGEIYQYVLHTQKGYEKKYSTMDLRTIQDWIVKRQLLGTPGVADVSSFGGYVKQYEISINPEKLRSHSITLSEIFTALSLNNQNTGGAYIDKKPNAYFIRGIGLVSGIEDIEKIVVKNINNIPVLIRDLATVQYGSAVRYGAMTRNTEGEVVGGLVLMLKGENSNQVIQNVKARVKVIEKSLPEGVVIEAFIDRSKLVNNAIHTVSKNLIEGGLIVIFVLVLLLGNLRAGLVVASVIPLAMLFAVSMMNIFGVSGNLMSLGAIDFGLIIDGAVIIVEAIVHRITGNNNLVGVPKLSQDQMNEEVFQASVKIRKSAAFGEIIILIVYLPILALVGIEGKMFRPMAETVSFAILGALILSLTYVPMMASLFLSKKTEHKRNISDKIMDACYRVYHPVIHYALRKRGTVIVISLVLLVISGFIFAKMGGEFIPTLEEGDFAVETRIASGSSLSQTIETTQKAADIILKNFPEVKEVVGKIGSSEIPTDPMPLESCDIIIILKDKSEWTSADTREELANKMSEALEVLPGVEFSFQQPIQMRFNELMTGARQDIAIKIYGEDLDILAAKAREASSIIQGTQGIGDIFVEHIIGLPQIMVEYNRDKIAQYGLNVAELNSIIRTAFAGEVAGVVYEGEKKFDLVVRLNESFRQNINDVKALYIPLVSGNQIPITEVANIQFKEGPMQISRDQAKRKITVGINVRERDVQSLVEEIQNKLDAQLKLPPGYYMSYGGQFQNLVEAKERLSIAIPVALALILMLLYFTFGSMKESLLIFTAIPFSAIGGIVALLIRGMPFSISAGIGFIALFGVAVLNGIVLISYFNQLKKEGMTDIRERVFKGTEVRLRPVLMTASVASLGFLPMALSNTSGAEVQKPLATVVIGGLISATLLTLIVLPVLYTFFNDDEKEQTKGSSVNPLMAILLLISLLISIPSNSYSQSVTVRNVNINQAVNEGLINNGMITTANYEIQSQTAFRSTVWNFDKTNVSLTYGQYNSIYKDNNLTISQTFAFPSVYANQSRLADANIKGSEQRLAVTQNELKRNIRTSYYLLLYYQSKKKSLAYQDSLYENFVRASELRYKVGESNFLEKVTAQTQQMEVKSVLAQTESDILIYQRQLQMLLGSSDKIGLSDSILHKIEFTVPSESISVDENPYLAYLKQQVEISKSNTHLERSRLLPDIHLGYFNQSLTGVFTINGVDRFFPTSYRFQGVQGGLSIPIWYKPQHARVNVAKINEQVANSILLSQQKTLQGELEMAIQRYKKYSNSVDFYEKSALPQAEIIIQNAEKAFKAGEINYIEFILSLNRALAIKSNYLDNLNFYNQSIISIEFILGGK
ncbi:MAG TPA: CusA/CzcA family heavy metal efflux RND transporter [Cytophagaceae bacterium]|nr:CusA/CzcA family heavy metal efflux RND transporter [Cytophagaceae bacterium]